MSTVTSAPARSFVLDDVDWTTYTRLLKTFAKRPSVRLAYDRGRLEIISACNSHAHEFSKSMFRLFVFVLAEELGIKIKSGGSTTYRRRYKKRGIEPDDSYWIANEAKVRGKHRLSLKVDPPPDLAIEIDLTSSLNRLSIYAALKIPEVWRMDNGVLTFLALGPSGKHAEITESLSFPGLRPADLNGFIALCEQTDQMDVLRQFRGWVRRRIADGWKSSV